MLSLLGFYFNHTLSSTFFCSFGDMPESATLLFFSSRHTKQGKKLSGYPQIVIHSHNVAICIA